MVVKRLLMGLVLIGTALLAILFYPVGGVIWHSGQVQRLAIVRGDQRVEVTSRAAIEEAVDGARINRVSGIVRAVTARHCLPQDLDLLTASGWVPVRIDCPGGLFLDFVPHPGM